MVSYNPPFRHEWQSAWRAIATAAVLLLGVAGLWQSRTLRPILWGSSAIITTNFALHLFYGLYYTLFAPHWEPALLMIMAGAFLLPHRLGLIGNIAMWAFAVLSVASSGALLFSIFDRLAAA